MAQLPPGQSPVFKRLLLMLRPQWGRIVLGVMLLIVAAPCELFPAIVWKVVTDDIVLQKNTSPWLMACFSFHGQIQSRLALLLSAVIWLFVIYLIGETLETLQSWMLNRVAQKFMLSFRDQVYRKLQSQSLAYFQRQRTGDLMSRAMGDVEELQSFIVNGIDVILSEGLLWLATVAIVMAVDWRVAGASLAPLIIVFFLLRVFNRRIRPIYTAARDRLGDVSTRLQENLSGVVVIKIFGREKQEAERFSQSNRAHYDQQLKAINARHLYFPFSRVVGFFSNVFMIGVGGYYMLTDGSFTPGDLVMFRGYWWRLFGPIQTLARVNDMVQRASAAGRRVFEVLDAPEELPDSADAMNLDRVQGQLRLENVSFAYQADGQRPVLHEITLDIPANQTIALCGPSGSGKTTILSLLLRFYDPQSGRVLLDGKDIRCIRRESLRSHCALVQQETFLFNDSILDNIRYGHGEATMQQVIQAAEAANAQAFISSLPNGYDTKVGERGVRLSGGQKQRISIARAFLANPTVLLLDEPTSSVEPDLEANIISALKRLMQGRTTVLTSHRPSLIRQANLVYIVEDGNVADSGSPEELINRSEWFARFMRSDEARELA